MPHVSDVLLLKNNMKHGGSVNDRCHQCFHQYVCSSYFLVLTRMISYFYLSLKPPLTKILLIGLKRSFKFESKSGRTIVSSGPKKRFFRITEEGRSCTPELENFFPALFHSSYGRYLTIFTFFFSLVIFNGKTFG